MNERLKIFLEYVCKSMQSSKFQSIVDYLIDVEDELYYMDASDWEDYCESDEFFDDVDYASAYIRKML